MKTLREYVMVFPWPRSLSPAAISHSSSRAGPRADRSASVSSRESDLPARARASARRSPRTGSVIRPNVRPRSHWGNCDPDSRAHHRSVASVEDMRMSVVALAGGVGAGKFLRGLVAVVPAEDVTVVVNTGDDIVLHGLHVSPDIDSVTYWLAGLADRERGWGRAEETFRTTEELRRLGAEGAWFGLGDLDLATHLFRTKFLADGGTLSEATAALSARFGLTARLVPMSDDPVTTRLEVTDDQGVVHDVHFQEYWVQRGGMDRVRDIRFEGAAKAVPAPGVIEAIADAEAILVCPSNPVASIDPILSVPGIRDVVARRRQQVAGVSPIVGGAPLRGMADKLLPLAGDEVSAAGVAGHYSGILGGWVIDLQDKDQAEAIEALGVRVAVTDTVMVDDRAAEALARIALELARSERDHG